MIDNVNVITILRSFSKTRHNSRGMQASFSNNKQNVFYISRTSLKKLILDVNRQKDALKKNGIFVDGKT